MCCNSIVCCRFLLFAHPPLCQVSTTSSSGSSTGLVVRDHRGEQLPAQLIADTLASHSQRAFLVEAYLGPEAAQQVPETPQLLVFEASVPPLGFATFAISPADAPAPAPAPEPAPTPAPAYGPASESKELQYFLPCFFTLADWNRCPLFPCLPDDETIIVF